MPTGRLARYYAQDGGWASGHPRQGGHLRRWRFGRNIRSGGGLWFSSRHTAQKNRVVLLAMPQTDIAVPQAMTLRFVGQHQIQRGGGRRTSGPPRDSQMRTPDPVPFERAGRQIAVHPTPLEHGRTHGKIDQAGLVDHKHGIAGKELRRCQTRPRHHQTNPLQRIDGPALRVTTDSANSATLSATARTILSVMAMLKKRMVEAKSISKARAADSERCHAITAR